MIVKNMSCPKGAAFFMPKYNFYHQHLEMKGLMARLIRKIFKTFFYKGSPFRKEHKYYCVRRGNCLAHLQ